MTIARPDRRNAVDAQTASELVDAFRQFDSDDSLHVAILRGEGGHFCAGADLKALSEGDVRQLTPDADGPMGPTRMKLSKPVIAAIDGYAVAGGLELALWCDLRVVSDDAVLGVFCRRFGVPLIDLGTIRLPRLIGHSRAMDLILTGREVNANEAMEIGLANRRAPANGSIDVALKLAEELAALPQTCMRGDRLSAIEQWSLSEKDATRNELNHGLVTINSGESLSGAAAFAKGKGRHGDRRDG